MKKRFSDRMGITAPPTTLQTEGMNDALRNSLWNLILRCLQAKHREYGGQFTCWQEVTEAVGGLFLKAPLDGIPLDDAGEPVNGILEEELSAYRFVQGELVAMSNPTEIAAIDEAASAATAAGLDGVQTHIRTALALLGHKPKPDYRNSIKESISAVESAAKRITGSAKGELKDALALLEGPIQLHGALKKGFLSLYGYSSDADGIRHALLDEPTVGFEEAKFMLVSCSAFATFLITKADAAGILKP